MLYLYNMENLVEKEMTRYEAVKILYNLLQLMEAMGAQDYERPDMNNLIERTKSGKIAPNEAVRQGYAIFNAKQDYH